MSFEQKRGQSLVRNETKKKIRKKKKKQKSSERGNESNVEDRDMTKSDNVKDALASAQ